MKILHVIQYFTATKGGSVFNVYNLSKYLSRRGHEVTIFTTENEFDPEFAATLHPVKVVPFKSYLGFLRYSPAMGVALDDTIKNFDVVHLNNYWSYQNLVASRSAIKHKVPYVLSPHGSLPIMMKGYARKILFERLFGNKILNNASKIVAVSEMEYKQVISKGVLPEKALVIPNAVDLLEDTQCEKGTFRRKFGIGKDEKIVLFLARIHPIKGVDLLVRAFYELTKIRSDVRLVIAGPDENFLPQVLKEIENFGIMDKVVITGPLYGKDKFAAYMDADIYVLPSRYEIFAISILEACSCGTPVIVTENQGIVNFIKGNAGEVVPFRWQEFSRSMEKLLSDDKLRAEYGRRAEKMVKEIFSWDKVIEQYEKVYEEVVK